MPKGFKVAPVEGRMLLDPFTIGRTHRRLGFDRVLDAEHPVLDPLSGKLVPHERYEWHGREEIVSETTDHYVRRAILNGDVDYIASVDVLADGTAKALPADLELLKATRANKAARAKSAADAAKAQVDADAAHAAALAAFDTDTAHAAA